jgi:hypothetical protein
MQFCKRGLDQFLAGFWLVSGSFLTAYLTILLLPNGLRRLSLLPNYGSTPKHVGRSRSMEPIKFFALDSDDLAVVSTHLQDAEVRIADVHWRPQEKRLVLGIDRFDWVAAMASAPELRRCRSALRFDRVLACKCKHVDPAGKDGILTLLAVEFEETAAPAGVVTLFFSGGAVLRLEVECLEAELADLGPTWTTVAAPPHAEDLRARG